MYAKITVQSGIRVQKHSGNIYFNIQVQVHCYHSMWSNITWILHHRNAPKCDLQDIIRYNIGRGYRAGKGSWESDKADGSRRSSDTFPSFYQVPILGPVMLLLRLWLASDSPWYSSSPVSGCQDATHRVHKKAKWRAQKQIHMDRK